MTTYSVSPRESYDLIVVGAGSAGFSAAITASESGASVALIGAGLIGGTCVNVGCVPSKTMIRAAEALHGAHAASRFSGLTGEARINDWAALMADKNKLVETLRSKKYIDLLADYDGIDYIEGQAVLNQNGVLVGENFISAKKIVIASGASPYIPGIPGLSNTPYLDSTAALELDALPRSMIVMGGGYIGCELAQMFARAGTQITLVTRSQLLPEAEPEVSAALTEYLQDENITVKTGLEYLSTEKTESGVSLTISVAGVRETINAQHLLLTTGRRANTQTLGLEDAGIKLRPNGSIIVDAQMRTSSPNIFAAGDVTGQDQFVYMAAYGAKVAVQNALGNDPGNYSNATMPWVVFTDPQVAGVGLSEAQAIEAGHPVKTSIAPLDVVPRALAAKDTRGLIKIIADADTDLLLGAQILAPEGSDSIQTMVMAIKFGMTSKALGETIFPYLTTVEGLKLAAQGFGKDVSKLSCCAG